MAKILTWEEVENLVPTKYEDLTKEQQEQVSNTLRVSRKEANKMLINYVDEFVELFTQSITIGKKAVIVVNPISQEVEGPDPKFTIQVLQAMEDDENPLLSEEYYKEERAYLKEHLNKGDKTEA